MLLDSDQAFAVTLTAKALDFLKTQVCRIWKNSVEDLEPGLTSASRLIEVDRHLIHELVLVHPARGLD